MNVIPIISLTLVTLIVTAVSITNDSLTKQQEPNRTFPRMCKEYVDLAIDTLQRDTN